MNTLKRAGIAFALTLFVAFGAAVAPASAAPLNPGEKPVSTWQVYNPLLQWLQVYSTEFYDATALYFEGKVWQYDGSATEPAAPTSEYRRYQSDMREAQRLENDGRTEEADEIRAYWGE